MLARVLRRDSKAAGRWSTPRGKCPLREDCRVDYAVARSGATALPTSMPLSPEAALAPDPERVRLLVVTKRRATGLLGLMAAVFVAAVVLGGDGGLMGFVRAGAEASLVGGLADWFAVTALFRHPLGLPIPHTAVISERKEQFGRTL